MIFIRRDYAESHAADDTTNNQTLKPTINTMFSILAEISGNINVAFAALGVPLGIGLIGFKACESVGRNPEAAPKVLVQSIIAMAFASKRSSSSPSSSVRYG